MFWRLPFGRVGSWPPISGDASAEYPALSDRIRALDSELIPAFTEHDINAFKAQRLHRGFHLALIFGALATSFIAALQAAFTDIEWLGLIVALLGGFTAVVTNQQRKERALSRYLVERGKAEELRSLYFRYLSGLEQLDSRELEAAIAAIEFPVQPKKSAGQP